MPRENAAPKFIKIGTNIKFTNISSTEGYYDDLLLDETKQRLNAIRSGKMLENKPIEYTLWRCDKCLKERKVLPGGHLSHRSCKKCGGKWYKI